MYLSIHALTGAAIGESVSSPLWAFTLGFIFHFIMDLIPHGDGELIKEYRNETKKKKILWMIGIDVLLTIVLISFYASRDAIDLHVSSVTYAIIGSVLPDVICAFYEVMNLFPKFHRFHTFNHNYLMQKITIHFLPGTIMQVMLALYLIRRITLH